MKSISRTIMRCAFALIISFVAIAANAESTVVEDLEYGGIKWRVTLNDDGTATLGKDGYSKGGDLTTYRAISTETSIDAANIPWQFTYSDTSYTVTAVAAYAFNKCTGLTGTLEIPNTVISLGANAFSGCTGLTELRCPNNKVKIWGNYVFNGNSNMAGEFPDLTAATTLGEGNFSGTLLTGNLKFGPDLEVIPRLTFKNCQMTGAAIIPKTLTRLGHNSKYSVFCESPNLTAIWVKGSDTAGTYTEVYTYKMAENCTSMKMILMGQNTKGCVTMSEHVGYAALNKTTDAQFFVPNNGQWDHETFTVKNLKGTNTKLWKYGPGQELDLSIDETAKTITFMPTTENALTNVIKLASIIKNDLGLDTVISVTNAIAMTDGVKLATSNLQNVKFLAPPWFLAFKVQNQTELNNVLNIIDEDVPIIVEVTGLNQDIKVPKGRKVAILANEDETFCKRTYGLVISFH